MSKKSIWLIVVLVAIVIAILAVWLTVSQRQRPAVLGNQVEEIINQELSGQPIDKAAVSGTVNPLANQSWQIVSLVDNQEVIDLTDYNRQLTFTNQQLSGSICNQFRGQYKLIAGDNLIADGPFITTEMACEPDLMKVESVFLAGLQDGWGYGINESGSLALVNGQGAVIGLTKISK